MAFTCRVCRRDRALVDLADLSCSCLVCSTCSRSSVESQLQRCIPNVVLTPPPAPKPAPRSTQIDLGDVVWYRKADGTYVEATVELIDITVQPPQYGIQLVGADNLRFTEEERLFSSKPAVPQASSLPAPSAASLSTAVHCVVCTAALPPHVLRRLAPHAVAAWEAERTASWLRVHDVISCPHPRCGALIQRVPAAAAGAAVPALGAAGVAAAAAAHRDKHRYRCGACGRDFCDACLAAPYHTGFTCRQARAPDCLLCGGKVEEGRLQRLLPKAAAKAAARDAGPGSEFDADAEARALVALATKAELRAAVKALDVDTVWCVEQADWERALLHWGARTCSSRECAAKLRAICSRPLPCGHWCCGLRGEGDVGCAHSHPRCVECGAGGAAAAKSPGPGTAGLPKECCFCWEPLAAGACIEMACGPRHMCHLQCALDRLAAGYPGPHISFTHLYCPLCREAGSGGGGGAGAGAGSSNNGGGQSALGPVHLQHPALAAALLPHLELREAVVVAVRARLKLDPELKADPELRPGGRYDGRPADYGLERLLFYKCAKCSKPYYGGRRACGAAGQEAQQAPPNPPAAGAAAGGAGGGGGGGNVDPEQQLVCGECCARSCGANCPRHGTAYIEWKCRFCCSLASWFCWGTTHMCEPCHTKPYWTRQPAKVDGNCTDPRCGLKGIPHPPPGQEACLGCGMCRVGL